MNDELKKHPKFWKAVFTHFPTPEIPCSLSLDADSSCRRESLEQCLTGHGFWVTCH